MWASNYSLKTFLSSFVCCTVIRNEIWHRWNFVLPQKKVLFTLVFIGGHDTAQKMKFSITDFFSKCDQIRRFLCIWSHLLEKSVMENFNFCAVSDESYFCSDLLMYHLCFHEILACADVSFLVSSPKLKFNFCQNDRNEIASAKSFFLGAIHVNS